MSTVDKRTAIDPGACPLCDRPNDCQLCTTAAYKGPCWCTSVAIPDELLGRVPAELRDSACICSDCVMIFHRNRNRATQQKLLPGDFYFDAGLMVFTAEYHLRRGWCCGSDCRHCPYHDVQTRLCKHAFTTGLSNP